MKKIIFDTDLGGDCDDVMALDLLISADKAGECALTGVTYSADCRRSPACIYAILKYYGMERLPVGRAPIPDSVGKGIDDYASLVADTFPSEDAPTYESAWDAVKLLRKLLAENGRSTVVVTGYLTNIAALLKSGPDEYSPLDGAELVRSCVEEFAVMGGDFAHQDAVNPFPAGIDANGDLRPVPEWNIREDIPAAQYVFDNSPVPVIVSPFGLGFNMMTGAPMTAKGKGKAPDSLAYIKHGCESGQHSWDPATALYGIYGAKPWFYRSAPGRVTVDGRGVTDFDTRAGGNARVLGCAMTREAIAADIDRLMMRLYD